MGTDEAFILITRRSWVQIPPPPPLKVQFRAGLLDRPFCCLEIHRTLNPTDGNTMA